MNALHRLRLAEAWARFGVWCEPAVERTAGEAEVVSRAASVSGSIVLVRGPSGSGKSRLLGRIADEARGLGKAVVVAGESVGVSPGRAVVAQSSEPVGLWLRTLARAGLGEAWVLARPGRELSDGERSRLQLALSMERALGDAPAPGAPGPLVVVDEFASVLDRSTGEGVARGFARWVGAVGARSGVGAVVASAHEDLGGLLGRVGGVIECASGAPACWVDASAAQGAGSALRIEAGTLGDFDALSRFHYRAGRPATVAGVWRAVRRGPGAAPERLAGVLVSSYPTLNGAWRRLAWGERYSGRAPAGRAGSRRRLNAEVRCISRVIVEPPSRGLGVARALVRAYLDDPATPRTEAVAGMGAVCPFFARAGMHSHALERQPRELRFERALRRRGLSPLALLGPEAAERAGADADVARALWVWANASGHTRRRWKGAPDEHGRARLLREAACRCIATPVAYSAG